MQLHQLTLANGYQMCIVEQFFSDSVLNDIYKLFDTFEIDSTKWDTSHPGKRYRYNAWSPEWSNLTDYITSPQIVEQFEKLKNTKLINTKIDLWVDLPGFDLPPHTEGMEKTCMVQIYITDQEFPYLGTTIFNNDYGRLFQLPFKNNFGYCFNKSDPILHGRMEEIPANFKRKSIMIWYDEASL